MAKPDIKAQAILFTERVGRHAPSEMKTFLADDVIFRSPLGIAQGREMMLSRLGRIIEAFPDLNVTVDFAVADGGRVAVRSTMRGTQAAPYADIPSGGRKFVLPQIMLLNFRDGVVTELEVIYDTRNFLEQLGAPPQPFQAV